MRNREIKRAIGNTPEGEARSIDEEIARLEEGMTRREFLRTASIITGSLAVPSILAACAEIPEAREVAKATPTPEALPTYTPSAPPEIAPSPTVTKEPTATATQEPTVAPTKEPTATRESTSEPEEPVEVVATGNVDLYLSPDGQKVGYFIPGQTFIPTGTEQDGWIEVEDSDGNILWIQEGGPYGPVGEEPEVTPTPPPTPEVVPSNEICAVGELEGVCYQRTPYRTGTLEDGHILPDGSVMHHIIDPDPQLGGRWRIAGRIERIDTSQNLAYLKGRNGDVISVKLMFDDPLFYARMERMPRVFNVPWREAWPEVRPMLIRDIQVGDYLYVAIDDVWAFEFAEVLTKDEVYRSVIKAQARYHQPLSGYRIEIMQ